jgi:hypothetical protein
VPHQTTFAPPEVFTLPERADHASRKIRAAAHGLSVRFYCWRVIRDRDALRHNRDHE